MKFLNLRSTLLNLLHSSSTMSTIRSCSPTNSYRFSLLSLFQDLYASLTAFEGFGFSTLVELFDVESESFDFVG
jgi:hypothetical protein